MTRMPHASPPDSVFEGQTPGVLFDERQDRRLAEAYAPCFILILQLRAVEEYGDPEVLRKRLHDLLSRTEREARRAGSLPEDVQAAQFAIVAFMDETILSSNWMHKDHWLARPLQLEFYDRYDAGEEFFVRLETLRGRTGGSAEVLEVYYLCMALGFKGRYQLHEQEKLRGLIEDTYAQLSRMPGMQRGPLSPHGKPHDQVATEMKSKVPAWAIALVALALGLLAYVGTSLYLSHVADETAQAIEAMATPAP